MEERKLTPQQAADRLGVHGDTVRRYIKLGIIRDVVKIGGLYKPRYLIPEREIERIQREAQASVGNDMPRLVTA